MPDRDLQIIARYQEELDLSVLARALLALVRHLHEIDSDEDNVGGDEGKA